MNDFSDLFEGYTMNFLYIAVILFNTFVVCNEPEKLAQTSSDKKPETTYMSRLRDHLCSPQIIKDAAGAYALGMGLTALHELGHGVTAQILCKSPLNLTLGAMPAYMYPPDQQRVDKTYFQIGFVKFKGFNPAMGYASTRIGLEQNKWKHFLVILAGPVVGALSSWFAFRKLQKKDGYYLTKLVALYGTGNHTVGPAGLMGAWIPGSDTAQLLGILCTPSKKQKQ